MVSNVFKVKKLNIHLGYNEYSSIAKKCIERGMFTLDDMYRATIVSSHFYPDESKKAKNKIYKAVCDYLEKIAIEDYDKFISHYYNNAYYNEIARENISDFLDGVSYIYKKMDFIPHSEQSIRFPYGKKFKLCYKERRKHCIEIFINTDELVCFWGSIDYFCLHFKNGLAIAFDHGKLIVYMDCSYI